MNANTAENPAIFIFRFLWNVISLQNYMALFPRDHYNIWI